MADEIEIEWSLPGGDHGTSTITPRAREALEHAQQTLESFDDKYIKRCIEREQLMPQLLHSDLMISQHPVRHYRHHVEYELYKGKASQALAMGGFHTLTYTRDDHYSVKFLQEGIVERDTAKDAVEETVVEVYILIHLQQHTHMASITGLCSSGIQSVVDSGTNGFFYVSDHIVQTLQERMAEWRAYNDHKVKIQEIPEINQRMQVAIQIVSALMHLHSYKLACYMRPDKVGFDFRGKVKLFGVGQCRNFGATEHPKAITKSDCMAILAYAAPEVFCGGSIGPGIDSYGIGVIIWEIIGLQRPFERYQASDHFEQIVRRGVRPEIDELWQTNITEVLRKSWDPYKRLKMETFHAALERMVSGLDPDGELLDVAKAHREKSANENNVSGKDDHKSAAMESVLVSLDDLDDIEAMIRKASSKLKAVKGGRSAEQKKSKNRHRVKGRHERHMQTKGKSDQKALKIKATGNTNEEYVARGKEPILDTTMEDGQSSDDNLHDSMISVEDIFEQSSDGDVNLNEYTTPPKSSSKRQLFVQDERKQENRSVLISTELKPEDESIQNRRNSKGDKAASPKKRTCTTAKTESENQQSTMRSPNNKNCSGDEKTERLKDNEEDTTQHQKGRCRTNARRARRSSMGGTPIEASNKSPSRSNLMPKQRSHRLIPNVNRREAFAYNREDSNLIRQNSDLSTKVEKGGGSFRSLEISEYLDSNIRKLPKRANSSDSIRPAPVRRPSLERERSLNHKHFIDLLNATSAESERPVQTAEKENKRSGIIHGLRKTLSSRNIFHNSMSAIELHDDESAALT